MIEKLIKVMEEQIDSDNFEEVQEDCMLKIEKEIKDSVKDFLTN